MLEYIIYDSTASELLNEASSNYDEIKAFALKIIIPSLVAVSIKLAIQGKEKSLTRFYIIASMVIGVGTAYLFSGIVMSTFSEEWIPLVIAVITISGEKIGHYFIYRIRLEDIINNFIDVFINRKS